MSLEEAIGYLGSTETDSGSSQWESLRRCSRAHHLRYRAKLLPIYESEQTQIGSLVHAAIRFVSDNPSRDWVDVVRAHESLSGELDIQGQQVRAQCVRLLDAYFNGCGKPSAENYHPGYGMPGWPTDCTVRGTEVHLAVEIGGRRYTTAIDTMLERSGELILVDTKTSSGLTRDLDTLKRQLRARPQFLGSVHCAQKVFQLPEPPTLMVNYIVKNSVPRFERVFLEFSNADIERWLEMHELSILAASCSVPNPDACWPMGGSGWKCTYFEYCHENRSDLYQTKETEQP